MEKIKYIVYKEKPGDETHEHDLVEVFSTDSLEEAKKKLNWTDNLYGRIDKVRAIYNSPPQGKIWKEERFAWDYEFIETIDEK